MFERSPERKRNRLVYYDYSMPGYYFITICTHEFISYFGSIKSDKMELNQLGKIACSC